MLAFQAGDSKGFDQIVAQYQSSVYHFVHRTIRDADRAEDLTQEVFIRVYRSRGRYRPVAKFRTWVLTIANRLALNEIRTQRRRRRVFTETPALDDAADDGPEGFWGRVPDRASPSPSGAAEQIELEGIIDVLVDRLPETQRAALQLHRSERFSYQEIADVLETSVMAVKSLLVRARESLKEGLERYMEGKNSAVKRPS